VINFRRQVFADILPSHASTGDGPVAGDVPAAPTESAG
jgi:hypothetical protein